MQNLCRFDEGNNGLLQQESCVELDNANESDLYEPQFVEIKDEI